MGEWEEKWAMVFPLLPTLCIGAAAVVVAASLHDSTNCWKPSSVLLALAGFWKGSPPSLPLSFQALGR